MTMLMPASGGAQLFSPCAKTAKLSSLATDSSARKVRTLAGGKVLTGFAGATADAFALLERLEAKLEQHPTQLARACVELAKDWRMDKYLRQLQAMMIVADKYETFILTGNGDVVQPDSGPNSSIAAIGSGGNYALSAAIFSRYL